MSETSDNWRAKQNWIKDVLSKSGTELMDISKNHVKIITEIKNGKKMQNNKDSSNNKMVYYQSTPLLIKTEQPSQTQFCLPLQATHVQTATTTTTGLQLHHQNEQQYFEILQTPQQHQQQQQQQQLQLQQQLNNFAIVAMQQQQQYQTPPSITTTTTTPAINGQNLLSNIKTELYGAAPTSFVGGASYTTISAVSSSSTTAGKTISNAGGRKPNSGANKPQFKCEQCGMTFGSKSAHTSHTKSHVKNAELIAGVSSMPFFGSLELNEAGLPMGIPKSPMIKPLPNVAAGADPYQCNVCQKTFAVPARLIRHYRTHTGERPFECEFCHKLFSVKENLQVHRRIHTKERPYKCDVCGRAFEHSGKLHRHMRIHTGERPHKCSVCEKTFIQSGQLVIHMRTHTGEKPYKCPVEGCGKGFTCSKQLKVHSRTHTGEKPYHCDICFRDFGYNHVLKLHRVQHYGSKCYKCTICDETFKSKKEMEAHIKGHANELPDDEEEAVAHGEFKAATIASTSPTSSPPSMSSLSSETNSPPNSPQTPTSTVVAAPGVVANKPKKPRQPRVMAKIAAATAATTMRPLSPSSPGGSVYSAGEHSSNSNCSTTMHSFVNALSSTSTSPTTAFLLHQPPHESETDRTTNSGDSNGQLIVVSSATTTSSAAYVDEMPTDLRTNTAASAVNGGGYYLTTTSPTPVYSYLRAEPVSSATVAQSQHQQLIEPPTINPALLEAASIHSSRHVQNANSNDDDEVQAALQIIQLHRGHQQQQQQHQLEQLQTHTEKPTVEEPPVHHATNEQHTAHNYSTNEQPQLHVSELAANYDDTHEANLLIEHYRRGELGMHGWHKGYAAPVPKYESSLPNQQDIVRRVEAAIGLRSSTESPERSSSPESDSLMMADRNVSTLPLRKRKVYMNEGPANNNSSNSSSVDDSATTTNCTSNGNNSNADAGSAVNAKVMRMSSVIQFAKAS